MIKQKYAKKEISVSLHSFINFYNKKMITEIWNRGIMVASPKIYYMYQVFLKYCPFVQFI